MKIDENKTPVVAELQAHFCRMIAPSKFVMQLHWLTSITILWAIVPRIRQWITGHFMTDFLFK